MKPGKISASMMCADLINLERDIKEVDASGCEYFHIDVMDGVFVPNFMLSNDFITNLRKVSNMPMDIHLMITEPENKIDWFDARKDDFLTIHYEATTNVLGTLQAIQKKGARPAIALSPATPVNVLEYILDDVEMILLMTVNPGFAGRNIIPSVFRKIEDCRELLAKHNKEHISIEVDGNMTFENAKKARALGADMFVAGSSSLFKPSQFTITEGMKRLREAIQ